MDDGIRRLQEAIAAGTFASAKNPAQALIDAVLGGGAANDDVALLVAQT
jgi:hypothetical protein